MSDFNLSHLNYLTDGFGIWQFCSKKRILKEYGYSLDDNARALTLALVLKKRKLANVYFNYLKYSYESNHFYGEIGPDKTKLKKSYPSSEDSFGEVVWALGLALKLKFKPKEVLELFNKIKPSIKKLKYARGLAYSILGLLYLDKKLASKLGKKLIKKFPDDDQRFWLEEKLTYGNGIIPYSLLRLYLISKKRKYLDIAIKALEFLDESSWINNYPAPIGTKGWYPKKSKKAKFDQQPICAAYMVMAFMAAFIATNNKKYWQKARDWFSWFHGNNLLNLSLYNEGTNRVHDGLLEESLKDNFGAESVICYFLAKWMLEKGKTI